MAPQLIPAALGLATALCLAFGLVAWLTRRRATAVAANGVAMGLIFAGSLLAVLRGIAVDGAAPVNLPGFAVWVAAGLLCALCFYSVRKPEWHAPVFWLAWAVNLGALAFLLYLVVGFRIF